MIELTVDKYGTDCIEAWGVIGFVAGWVCGGGG